MAAMMKLLNVTGLSKRFGGLPAVEGVDMSLAASEIHALIGPNGAGKSTSLNMLSGITPPSSGTIEFEGRRIDGLRPSAIARIGVGRSFQVPRLFAGLTLLQNVMTGYHCFRKSSLIGSVMGFRNAVNDEKAMAIGAMEMLELVGLADQADRLGSSATFVQQRKVELARAMASKPRLLLLDEPAAGMNAVEMAQFTELLRTFPARGTAILFIEHHMRMVMDLADRITVLNFGRKIAEGTPDVVRKDPAVLAAYLGGDFGHAAV
jgi:branched-chain amino acid transport system ATP-binding protein